MKLNYFDNDDDCYDCYGDNNHSNSDDYDDGELVMIDHNVGNNVEDGDAPG